MDSPEFTLHLDGVKPDDLPMRRLADYLEVFARLLGEEASTRFAGVQAGSTLIVAKAAPTSIPKIRDRLQWARDGGAADVTNLVNKLDAMMAEDNVHGCVREAGEAGVVIRFPGASRRTAAWPVISEEGSLQGELVRIGGKDDTAHAQLRDGDQVFTCTMGKDLARRMSKHLYGTPLRVFGRGRWRRGLDGAWQVIEFRASEFQVLDDASLAAAATRLQQAGGFGLRDDDEAWQAMRDARAS